MDGPESDKFENFKSLINAGLSEIKKHIDELENFIMILAKGKQQTFWLVLESKMPCFLRPDTLMMEIKDRLKSQPVLNPDPTGPPKSEFFELTERIVK